MKKTTNSAVLVKGPNGRMLKVYWMGDDRIRISIPAKVGISSLYPGKPTKPDAKIIIQLLK